MKFNIGDKVRFLNEKGEGIVTKIISSTMVGVSIEDGFEIPAMTSNLLLDVNNDNFNKNAPPVEDVGQESDNIETLMEAAGKRAAKGFYLGFVPHDQKWLITGIVDIFIINNSDDDILYNIFLKNEDGLFIGADYGSVPSNSKALVASPERDDLNIWTKGAIQIMSHPVESDEIPLPVHLPFKINSMKFLKEDNYKNSVFFAEKAFVLMLAEASYEKEHKKDNDIVSVVKEDKEVKVKDSFIISEPPLIDKHRIDEDSAEVDLHIESLVEDSHLLLPNQKLKIQLDYFHRCLSSAISARYRRVIFIHGVGNGILKRAIVDALKDFEGLEYYDAPLNKYGVGATEVIIHHNLIK